MLFGLLTTVVLSTPAAAWSISGGKVGIAMPGDPGELVSFANADTLSLGPSRTLNVEWQVPEAPPLPRQASLRLYNEVCDHVVTAKVRGKKAKAVVTYHSLPACLSGAVNADILVAGGSSSPARAQKAFSLQVQEIAVPELDARLERPMAAEPEILHQFRPEPRRVNPVIALVFVGAIDVLFVGLLVFWNKEAGIRFASLDFAVSLVAIELVFVAYFISASIFTAISAVAALTPIAVFTGQRALRKEHRRRNTAEK